MPKRYVDEPAVEYSELNAKVSLQETVLKASGDDGFNKLINIITDFLGGFSENGASYVEAILAAKTSRGDQAKLD